MLGLLRHFLARLHAYVRLIPVRTVAGKFSPAAFLAHEVSGAHGINLYVEYLLYGFFHFGLGRLGGDFEHQRAFGLFYAQALFRNHRAADDLIRGLHYATSALRFGALAFSESCNFSSAGRQNTAVSKRSRWYASTLFPA